VKACIGTPAGYEDVEPIPVTGYELISKTNCPGGNSAFKFLPVLADDG